ncbi:MAG: O-antigen ligase family protein [Acidimicrobiales bacterium]
MNAATNTSPGLSDIVEAQPSQARRPRPGQQTVAAVRRRQWQAFVLAYGAIGLVFIVVMGLMRLYPPALGPALIVLLGMVGLSFVRPAFAFGATVVLAVIGDAVVMPWWPATKNLSSAESILFITDALTVKPVDIVLVAIVGAIIVNRRLSSDAPPLRYGPLWRPLLIFSASIFVGIVWGLGRGGDLRVAFFEVTPLLYIPMVYFAATNLFTSLQHYRRLMVGIVIALTIEAIHAISQLSEIRRFIGEDQSAFEHVAAIHFNIAMLLAVAIGWFGAKREWPRPVLLIALVPIVYLYLDGERRAGVIALIAGGILLSALLFVRDRQKFLRTIPAAFLIFAVYSAAFWGASGSLAFPAQAVRSVVQPDSSSEQDSLSELYRDIENVDLNLTIRSNPILGVGFGNEFLKPIPLPDIGEFFEFADYIPHNTVLWIWIKTGLVGFLSFVYMSGLAIALGVRGAVRIRNPVDMSVIAVFVSFVPMTLVVAYVEISGDPTTMTLFGLALAAAGNVEGIAAASGGLVGSQDRDTAGDLDPLSGADIDQLEVGAGRRR